MATQSRMYDDAGRRFERRKERLRADFLPKLKLVLAHIPFAPDLLAAYYAVLDRETPFKVRVTLAAALAYFVLPFDVIPDFIVGLGFTDDAAVLYAAIRMVSGSIQPRHHEAARRWLEEAKAGR
ncbi:YkvA family protein [Labrys neptuniae]